MVPLISSFLFVCLFVFLLRGGESSHVRKMPRRIDEETEQTESKQPVGGDLGGPQQ